MVVDWNLKNNLHIHNFLRRKGAGLIEYLKKTKTTRRILMPDNPVFQERV
jgi:hypothetical protein